VEDSKSVGAFSANRVSARFTLHVAPQPKLRRLGQVLDESSSGLRMAGHWQLGWNTGVRIP